MYLGIKIQILLTLVSRSFGSGIGTAWDISPNKNTESTTHSSWLRGDLSAFEVRSVSGIGQHQVNTEFTEEQVTQDPQLSRNAKELEDMDNDYAPEILFEQPIIKSLVFRTPRKQLDVEIIPSYPEEKSKIPERKHESCPESFDQENFDDRRENHPRLRRETTEDSQMEKISGIKNSREARMNSPESWSKQPLSIDFRHRTSLDGIFGNENTESRLQNHEEPPHVDFITGNRRSSNDARESRDLPVRSYDDIYRNDFNNFRDSRDLDMAYSRSYYYPDQIRTEREFIIGGVNDPTFSSDRYRIEDFDMYRNRPTQKPKRIICYATLPEIVRKPIDLRSYTRPYDSMGRASIPPMNRDPLYKKLPSPVDSRYRYRNYPQSGYDAYDSYMKRSTYFDRSYVPSFDRFDESKYREQNIDHASFKEASRVRDESRKLDNVESRSEEKLPWPVQVGTEVNIKDSNRIAGRKIYGSHQDFDRFRPSSRIDESSEKPSGDKRD